MSNLQNEYFFYKNEIIKFKTLITNAEKELLNNNLFLNENINFITKSLIVTLCSYLESYVKNATLNSVVMFNEKIKGLNLPHNLIKWVLNGEKNGSSLLKEVDLKYENFKIEINKKDLEDFVSGNPYKIKKIFNHFGINTALQGDEFSKYDESINAIINKRNSIIHHNNNVSDISLNDVSFYADEFLKYIDFLNDSFKKLNNE